MGRKVEGSGEWECGLDRPGFAHGAVQGRLVHNGGGPKRHLMTLTDQTLPVIVGFVILMIMA